MALQMTQPSSVHTRSSGEMAHAAFADDAHQYLRFTVANEIFMVDILHIKEIIEYGNITEIPMMPGFVRGVINLRGAVVPVIDLAVRFNHKPTTVSRRTCVVIIETWQESGAHDIGIVVDAVHEVIELQAKDIEPTPAFGAKVRTDFIWGMGKVNDDFVIILHVEKVLSVEEMTALTDMNKVVN